MKKIIFLLATIVFFSSCIHEKEEAAEPSKSTVDLSIKFYASMNGSYEYRIASDKGFTIDREAQPDTIDGQFVFHQVITGSDEPTCTFATGSTVHLTAVKTNCYIFIREGDTQLYSDFSHTGIDYTFTTK